MDNLPGLFKNERWMKSLFQQLEDGIAIVKKEEDCFLFLYVNPSLLERYPGMEGNILKKTDHAAMYNHLCRVCEAADRKNGQVVPIAEEPSSPFQEPYQLYCMKPEAVYCISIDGKARRGAGRIEMWMEDAYRYRSLVETSPDAVFVHDQDDRIVYINQTAVHMIGVNKPEDVYGQDIKRYFSGENEEKTRDRLRRLFAGLEVKGPIERQLVKVDGTCMEVEVHGGLVHYSGEKAVQTVCRDISERRMQQEKLKTMAYYDQLTNVANRRYFFDKLNSELEQAEEDQSMLALLFIDLDNFKQINDRYGHQIGDEILVIFTKRVKQKLRDSDTLSRLGGDEFVILLTSITSGDQPNKVADRIMNSITKPIFKEGRAIHISASIGISIYPDHGRDRNDLMTRADRALYDAKERGRSRISVSTEEDR